MSQRKLFFIAFVLITTLTGFLCFLFKQPLALGPVPYGNEDLILFLLLSGFLSFALVWITLPLLRYCRSFFNIPVNEEGYYILATLFILQLVTLVTGYLESSMSRYTAADWLYYYKGVTNSHLWIISGNLIAAIIASLYARKQRLKKEEDRDRKRVTAIGK